MQDESTGDMIFDVERLRAYTSRTCAVVPGDLLLTGSPAGNGMHHRRFLRPATSWTARSPAWARSATAASRR